MLAPVCTYCDGLPMKLTGFGYWQCQSCFTAETLASLESRQRAQTERAFDRTAGTATKARYTTDSAAKDIREALQILKGPQLEQEELTAVENRLRSALTKVEG